MSFEFALTAERLSAMHADDRAGALDAFLASVEKRALRIAEMSTRNRDEALDIVQDVMLKLARRYGDKPPPEWPALFFRILQNQVRDWARRQAVRRRVLFWQQDLEDDEPYHETIASPGPDAQAAAQQAQAMECLVVALRALPPRQREAFELRIWQGLSVEETALAMGCSDGSVKTHLHRALTALRKQLRGVWP